MATGKPLASRRRGRRIVLALTGAFAAMLCVAPGGAQAPQRTADKAVVLDIDGAIGPATADYVAGGLNAAAGRGARLVVLRMDTPGGLDTSMRDIIRSVLASPVPVAAYVAPAGARAASAGTYILYASHVAAMAPGTNLGAATPISLGGGGLPVPGGQDRDKASDKAGGKTGGDDAADKGGDGGDEKAGGPAAPADAAKAKMVNDAVAYIRSLAELRGRNADWAERAVRQAASLSARAALDEGVIDFTAGSIDELLDKADGMTVSTAAGETVLRTAGLGQERIEPDWRTRLLATITNPNIALILMMIGIYGLFFEFLNPGSLYPGTIGAICLLVALYALAALPVNYAGAGLILLGLALMAAEAFAPSFGILGIGGGVAFVLGAAILVDTDSPAFTVSWTVIGAIAAASLVFALVLVPLAVGAYRRKVVTGREELVGANAEVRDWRGKKGHVFAHGERWRAVSGGKLKAGQRVRITGVDGLTLTVERAGDAD